MVKLFFKAIFRCVENIQAEDYLSASRLARTKTQFCKKIILTDENASSQTKKIALIFGICFKALEELSELSSIVSNKDWISNPKDVQNVWFLLQNNNDRFKSVLPSLNFPEPVSEFIKKTLQDVEKQIEKGYGKGLYVSPEVIIEDSVCNICNQDPRSCSHIQNQVYDGKICRILPIKIKPGFGIVLTSNPKDKRCRMWPWESQDNTEDKGITVKNVPILVSFRIDDFLD